MKRIPFLAAGLLAALSAGIAGPAPLAQTAARQAPARPASRPPAKPAVHWEPSFEAALKKARAQRRPIFVDFYTTWCGPCKLLDKYTYTNSRFIQASRRWIMVKVDAEKREPLANKYKVDGYPTMVFLRPDGTLEASIGGYWEAKTLVQKMAEVESGLRRSGKIKS